MTTLTISEHCCLCTILRGFDNEISRSVSSLSDERKKKLLQDITALIATAYEEAPKAKVELNVDPCPDNLFVQVAPYVFTGVSHC